MNQSQHNGIVSFIWGIADDILRDVYVRGKYRDVILTMTVIRRLDSLLEPTKDAVLKQKKLLDGAGIVNQEAALCQASGQAFYNTSEFTLRTLMDSPSQLRQNFAAYLDGFSANVREIVEKFDFRNQLRKLDEADVLGQLIERFLNPDINLSPEPVYNDDGSIRLPSLTNLGMGYVFEELIRRFNEENNEEAGEHFTPREIVRLMAALICVPVKDQLEDGTYLVYDCACGTGGMLTEADAMLKELAAQYGKEVTIHLYGQEINAETYAICKADLLIKGEEERNIAFGSTLSADAFPSLEFDFMLANPPYGKSWKSDLERLCGGDKREMRDPRFVVEHDGDPEFSLVTRSSDGQLMFLVNMLSKMKRGTRLGSRIAIVHNGSSLFTGDAGQGESNIRRWIIENDWLECIIGLPENLFYNTGIATYIWVLTNRKPEHRRGKVQLIDATARFTKLRRNLGQKNCELSPDDISEILRQFVEFEESECSKIFDNQDFGYRRIVVERPLRLSAQFTRKSIEPLRFASGDADIRQAVYDRFGTELYESFSRLRPLLEEFLSGSGSDEEAENGEEEQAPAATARVPDKVKKKILDPTTWERDRELLHAARKLHEAIGEEVFNDHNVFRERFDAACEDLGLRLSATEKKAIVSAVSRRNPEAKPVVKRALRDGTVEYEPDTELRDTEKVPLKESIADYFDREVAPYVPDAWVDYSKTVIGYEISFTKHFYRHQPLRSLEEIKADILALEAETDGLLKKIIADAEVPA